MRWRDAWHLIRYSTLRRRQCLKINNAARDQNTVAHDFLVKLGRARFIPNAHRIFRLTRKLHRA
jgi:hypothetical protein